MLVEEDADLEAGGLAGSWRRADDEVEGQAGGNDVLDEEDVATGDVEVEILGEADALGLASPGRWATAR